MYTVEGFSLICNSYLPFNDGTIYPPCFYYKICSGNTDFITLKQIGMDRDRCKFICTPCKQTATYFI